MKLCYDPKFMGTHIWPLFWLEKGIERMDNVDDGQIKTPMFIMFTCSLCVHVMLWSESG